jgi:subtilase family serine protease
MSVEPQLHIQPQVTNNTPTGFVPWRIRHGYGIDKIRFLSGQVAGTGFGQTIAIVDAYDHPNITADLAKFNTTFGLPQMDGQGNNPTFTKIKQTSSVSSNSGWALEIALDVEWAHAVAPFANIVLLEAQSSSVLNLLSMVNTARNRAGVVAVSMSWGANEFSSESSYDSYFTTPSGHAPITFVASSGDSGAPVIWPAISSNVLSVGGTTLNLDSGGNYISETGWSGSGGGVSAYISKPSYQSALPYARRSNPDVAYDANPSTGFAVYDSVTYSGQSGWFKVGGTSAGAPQWAGLVAIADQGRALSGKTSLNGRTQTLPAVYSIASTKPGTFHDITSGSSTGSPVFTAGSGFDLVTGEGSPISDMLEQQLIVV